MLQSSISVKLNNPLMGTETYILQPYNQIDLLLVKLNNPLMGTETILLLVHRLVRQYALPVKLNNPLMGTETF